MCKMEQHTVYAPHKEKLGKHVDAQCVAPSPLTRVQCGEHVSIITLYKSV